MVVERKRRNGKNVYNLKFKTADGWVEELGSTNRREAERMEAKRKAEVAAGTYRKGKESTSALTVEGYSKEWLSGRRNKTKSDDEQRIRDYVIPALGKKRLRDLRASDCIEFVKTLVNRGLNPKTIGNIWGAFRTMLRDAYIAELIGFSPVMPRGIIPDRQGDIKEIYSDADAQLLCSSELDGLGMVLFCVIAFYTGMRQGEICGLRWGDFLDEDNFDRLGALIVRRQYAGEGDDATTKTSRTRLVPVHPVLATALRCALVSLSPSKHAPIVPLRPGEHHSKSTSYKAFVRHCDYSGVTSLGVHRTRHTAITAMRRGGAPAEVVERITHNSKGTIVDRYTHDWKILCAAVSCIDYASRGVSRGELPKTTVETSLVPGSIPGASTGQNRKTRDNRGQIAKSDVQDFSGFPALSARRDAQPENGGSENCIDTEGAPAGAPEDITREAQSDRPDAAAHLAAIVRAWDLITEAGYPTLAGLKLLERKIEVARKAVTRG